MYAFSCRQWGATEVCGREIAGTEHKDEGKETLKLDGETSNRGEDQACLSVL